MSTYNKVHCTDIGKATVTIGDKMVTLDRKKKIGRDASQSIPLTSIVAVTVRKTKVIVTTKGGTVEWITKDARELGAELVELI